MTHCYTSQYDIAGAEITAENPLPIFRDANKNIDVLTHDSFPENKKEKLGYEIGFRVLPYRMQDHYSRDRQPLAFKSVVLENETLKATFLPQLGGRLVSLYHKPEQRELLSRNPIFQPANLAIRNAWFSGGIEWNVGQFGHAFSTCSPVFAALIRAKDGQPGIRLYDFERCKQLFWQIDFYLSDESPFLLAYTRIVNYKDHEIPMYYWSNIAVPEKNGVRILSPTDQVIFIEFSQTEEHRYGYGRLPHIESAHGKDATYPTNFNFANEYFFQCDGITTPWEAAIDEDGKGFIEFSSSKLNYRKMFCWGMHRGGRRWQNHLSLAGNEYIEIQAGLAPTQMHGMIMPARSEWDWVQVFAPFSGDARLIHQQDYGKASGYIQECLKNEKLFMNLSAIEKECRASKHQKPETIFQTAAGWGALEQYRLEKYGKEIPHGFLFPASTIKDEQRIWLDLLDKRAFPDPDPLKTPGEWMVQGEWLEALQHLPCKNWFSLLHEGVMQMELGNQDAAVQLWLESIDKKPSPWALRNLAATAKRKQQINLALDYYRKAWQLLKAAPDVSENLVVEYLQCLIEQQQWIEARDVFAALPQKTQEFNRIQILYARIALHWGDFETVQKILEREFSDIREGEVELTDIWYEMMVRRHRHEYVEMDEEQLRSIVIEKYPPPENIDFRMS